MRRLVPTCVLVLAPAAMLILLAPLAASDEITISDGNDIAPREALDIREASMGHRGADKLEATITTFAPFSVNDLNPDEAVLGFAFSNDDDPSDLERILFVFAEHGRFHAVMTDGHGHGPSEVQVSHPNPRMVRIVFYTTMIDRNHYLWFAFADTDLSNRCCFDAVPNRKWAIHDYGDPRVTDLGFGTMDGQAVAEPTVRATFNVEDAGIGIDEWSVYYRTTGTSAWSMAGRGSGDGEQTVIVPTSQGGTYDVCVAAVDHAGNVSDDDLAVVDVPFDDTSAELQFGAGWTASASIATDFLGTRHSTSTIGATVQMRVPGGYRVGLIAPGGFDGFARVFLNGQEVTTINMTGLQHEPRQSWEIVGSWALVQPSNTIVIEVESGTLVIDGIIKVPDVASVDGRC